MYKLEWQLAEVDVRGRFTERIKDDCEVLAKIELR